MQVLDAEVYCSYALAFYILFEKVYIFIQGMSSFKNYPLSAMELNKINYKV